MGRKNLTDAFVSGVKVDVRTDFWDEKQRGLVLRVAPTGVKSWTAVYTRESDKKKRRFTIGSYPKISLKEARSLALAAIKAVDEGHDPAKTKQERKGALTLEDLGGMFIRDYAKPRKRSWAEDERILRSYVYPTIGPSKAQDVTKRDLLNITDAKVAAGSPVQADRILATVRKLYNWALSQDHIKVNPLAGIQRVTKPVQRDRVLSDAEVAAIFAAMAERPLPAVAKDVLHLAFLTGQRSGEVGGMRLGEVRLDNASWVIPKERSKNKLPHLVPLSTAALAIIRPRVEALQAAKAGPDAPLFTRGVEPLDSRWIAKMVRAHLAEGFAHWTPHDIRRTVATGMGDMGVLPHVIESTLNHISGFRAGVAGTYNLAKYAIDKKDALDRWANRIEQLQTASNNAVIPLSDYQKLAI